MGWTKLDNGIIHSTIWRESKPTRLVWITMLAMVNKNGNVCAALPGLADAARVTIEECQAALETLKAPDPWSRTKEHEGRRIEEIDGGWFLYNHAKYRGPFVAEKKREANRMRQQKYRDKHNADGVTHNAPSRCNAHADADADAEEDAEEDKREEKTIAKKKPSGGHSAEFEAFWSAYPKKKAKGNASKAWTNQRKNGNWPGDGAVMTALDKLVVSPDWTKDGGKFVPYPATWLNGDGWCDEPTGAPEAPAAQPKSKFRQEMDLLDRVIAGEEPEQQEPLKVDGKVEVV